MVVFQSPYKREQVKDEEHTRNWINTSYLNYFYLSDLSVICM